MLFFFQIDTTEDTPSDSDIWSSETTFSQDSQEFACFLPSSEHPPEEEDSSAPAETSRESARTEDETVCLLRQKIAELTAEKEDLQTRVETQEAQVAIHIYIYIRGISVVHYIYCGKLSGFQVYIYI